MIRTALLVSALLAGGCATVSSAPAAPYQMATPAAQAPGLSPAQVSQGFVEAIVLGCAAAAEAGKPISEIAGTAIVRDEGRPAMLKPRGGGTAWAPASAKGIVMIDEGPAECEVSAYGPPAQATLNAAGEALSAKGFAVSSPMQTSGGIFFATYSKQAGGRTVTVSLSGNDPGAPGMRSRFSTLGARVSAK